MLRASLCSVAVLAIVVSGLALAADDTAKQHKKKGEKATITKVDPEHGTITVRMKNKEGKEVNRTFHFTGELQMFDDNGKTLRVADIAMFRSGDKVLLVEREGKIREMHHRGKAKNSDHDKNSNSNQNKTNEKK